MVIHCSKNIKTTITNVLSASDSLKGTLNAETASQAISQGVKRVYPDCHVDVCPLADGGEGSLAAVYQSIGGVFRQARVCDPLGRTCQARWLHIPKQSLGLIEMAEASGLLRVDPQDRRPLLGTTYGTGQLLKEALQAGCQNITLFLGGSATIDGGIGIAQALGAKLFDAENKLLAAPLPPEAYLSISSIDTSHILRAYQSLQIACDVTNPLVGINGAAETYAAQKGATPSQVKHLQKVLLHVASLCPNTNPQITGGGAAGGAGFGMHALLGGTMVSGIDTILEIVNFNERCKRASLVITGEGQLDAQTQFGKACGGVAMAAAALSVPTIAVVGRTAKGFESMLAEQGGPLADYINLSTYVGSEMARTETAQSITQAVEQWLKTSQ